MQLMVVVLNECWKFIYDRLEEKINFLKEDEITVHKECYKQGKIIQIEYRVKDSNINPSTIDDFKHKFQYYMANVFSDIIMYDMEEKIAYKILSTDYYYFGLQERKSILSHFKKIQKNEGCQYEEDATCVARRKQKILGQIIDYLEDDNRIHLEGFVRFRLKNYIEELENNIERAIEDFLMEKEYNEFIRLLRYFVDIQDAKIDTVNVLMSQDGKYHLYDDRNSMINNEYIEDLASEMVEKDISYEDLLISALITLAPKKIIMHFSTKIKKKEIIETIKNVFSERVCICSGCDLCLSIKKIKQE
ncbi:putative sporulation protein YtxC [Marinisporobacter balticus]|uniref:Putative sporulation protein YtxC n=1 Tax=Marinisporobacter balticus TaxID=2018667 RepID=A0A4R2KRR9_9FIRM|nr:putative sporulation protein YtxC [Marinisporobacter balticus]TCO73669.1 putative sporulation protein YtxC [Marinisporobacter balticus]